MAKYIDINGMNLLGLDIFNDMESVFVGNPQRDLVIRTKGKIKIQYGSKFYSLFDLGELAAGAEYVTREQVEQMINDKLS